jgi:hypothetical protein
MTNGTIDFDRLLKLRLVVARVGEMDLAKWWNTRGQLSRLGSAAVRRGLPRTHYFAQARSVFAVAGFRCREVFDPPQSATLWHSNVDAKGNLDAAIFKIANEEIVSSFQGDVHDTPALTGPIIPGMEVEKIGRTTGHRKGKVMGSSTAWFRSPTRCPCIILPASFTSTRFSALSG